MIMIRQLLPNAIERVTYTILMEAPGADSEDKREPASDIDTYAITQLSQA
jgi:hypothetical protein